jgi:ATP-binding cassette subfamily C protein
VDEVVTIGRSDDCSIILKDNRVSRKHARVERTLDGYRVLDTDSANGVLIGQRRVRDAQLSAGDEFIVADTVFRLEVPPPPTPPPPPPRDENEATLINVTLPEFVVRIVESKGGEPVGKEWKIATGSAVLGRSEECDIVLADNGASRRHARIEAVDLDRFRIVDTKSANGVWVGERRISEEPLGAGQRFRIGDTFFECRSVVKKQAGTSATQVIKDLPELMAKVASQRLEEAGEAMSLRGSHVVVLDDPGFLYYVTTGVVEIFTVTLKDGRPLGARNHFLTLKPGEALFGIGTGLVQDSGFMAAGKTGTVVRRISRKEVLALAREPNVAAHLVRLTEAWVSGLSARLTRDVFPRPDADVRLEAGQEAALTPGQHAKAMSGVLWVEMAEDALLFIGMTSLRPEPPGALFPLTPLTWIEPDRAGEVRLRPRTTTQMLAEARLWDGLDAFHQTLGECEFLNKRLAVVDEFHRLDNKARQSDQAREKALDAIGAVLAGRHTEPEDLTPSGDAEPFIAACREIGQAQGMKIVSPVETRAARTFEDQLHAISSASRFRTRRVTLKGDWWLHDQGPFLARREDTKGPVALLPKGPRRYVLFDPTTRKRQRVTAEMADNLIYGYVFYRPFPPGPMPVRAILGFGARGLRADLTTLISMGLITGFLGTATPYLTGQMVDGAIPQGDHSLLLQLGLGMIAAAVAGAAFKFTQSFAVTRVESKMDYALQAALWDRLLDLPSEFFRRFGAGDLAERAAGINAIRGLLSRAGVTGILGSLSSLAYLGLMLSYNVKLTVIGMAITAVLVGITTAGNYLQLRFQRQESQQRGQISSLVLQLIAGVAKVRVSAAENHAFRVWAQKFSSQKSLGFSIGQIQNVVGTLSSAFPVLSSLGIFGALYYLQMTALPGQPPPFTTGTFVAFNGAFGTFIGAMQSLADASLSLLQAVPIFERLSPILTALPETDEGKAHPGRLRGEIRVSHLSFRYHPDSPYVLKDISFTIEPGHFVAFVGGSGCGKSTMMRLLLGFERPSSGALYYDGQDLETLDTRALRQQLGVVLQESRLLPTDIFRNIVGTTSHTMDEAWEAAEMAGLAEDIRGMPMGMHTVVSEGGGTFSGGQRQRLLIARALVNKPRVIFFDEATSALDNRTQSVVTQSMDRMDSTRIVIAHRLSTVANADRIFYFDGGQVREEGTYDELMAKGGLFAALAQRQIA